MKITLFFIFLFYSIYLSGQTWERTITSFSDVYPSELLETYDKGFILGAGIGIGNLIKIGWIIKMDMNGNIMWDKKIGNGSNLFYLNGIDNSNDGGLIFTGTTDTLNHDQWDPYVVKMNSCGEVEWCRIFQTDQKTEFGTKIRSLPDNSYAMLVYDWKKDMSQGTFLYHLSQDGELIWEQEYFVQDTVIRTEYPRSLELTSENDFLITGYCYYPDSGQVTPWWLRPMIILADSSGEAVIELYWGYSLHFGGEAFQTVSCDNGFYTCVSDYPYPPDTGFKPAIIKTSVTGIPVFFHDIIENTKWGKASTLDKISDSTFFAGIWYSYSDVVGSLSVAKVDTNGNLLKEKVIKQTEFIPRDAIVTSDQKYLITALDYQGNDLVTRLWKLNMDMEYDSIYTQPHNYDSLCDHAIPSETLFFPCDVIVSTQENELKAEREKMVVYPNPGHEEVHVKLPEIIQLQTSTTNFNIRTRLHKWYEDLTFQIADFSGKVILNRSVRPDEKEILIQVSGFNTGLYCFILRYKGNIVGIEKVLIY